MNEVPLREHREVPLSRVKTYAVTLGFYSIALATGVVCAIESQARGFALYLILLLGSIMGALAFYFIWAAISFCVHSVRRRSASDDNSPNG